MSVHLYWGTVTGVYCHGVWYKCKKGSFGADAYELQIYGSDLDLDTNKGSPVHDWIFMSELHPEIPLSHTAAFWTDPVTNERITVFMHDITAFKDEPDHLLP